MAEMKEKLEELDSLRARQADDAIALADARGQLEEAMREAVTLRGDIERLNHLAITQVLAVPFPFTGMG
jgi:hypothetical protein